MKIRIFGDIASGKSTLAKKLGNELGVSVFTTDECVYLKKYAKKRSTSERKKLAEKIIIQKNWIIEGVHHSDWIRGAAKKSDLIIIFDVWTPKLIYRIIKRTIFEEKQNNKFKSMVTLIKMLLRDSKDDLRAYKKIAKNKNHLIGSNFSISQIKSALAK
jgi:adenylate kinase family enzyme